MTTEHEFDTIEHEFDKLFVASVTPWGPDGRLDEQQLRRLMRYYADATLVAPDFGIIVNPEAGEVFYLSADEQARIVEIALDEVGDRVPVWTGLLANSTDDIVALAERLAAIEVKGARVGGLFVMPPIGAMDITIAWDADQYPEVWEDMLAAIAERLPETPLICHPVTSPTPGYGVGLPLGPTIDMLTRIPQIVGWKMTYNYEGFRRVARGIRALDRHVGVLGATAVNFHENLAGDALDGTVTGSFNYALEPMLAHIAAWRRGDLDEARRIWADGLAALHEYVYESWGRLHVRYKTAAWLHGVVDSPIMRAPLPRPRRAEVDELARLIRATGMSIIDDAAIAAVRGALSR